MTWAEARRLAYALGVVAFLLLCASPFIYRYATVAPTCFDGIQNQGETEVDKGGPCIVRADDSISPVTVRFAKAFKIEDGVYSVVGYIENPNRDVGLRDARYEFTLFDDKGIFVATRRGRTFIPPQAVVPIFEAKILTGSQIPTRTDLTFTPAANWEKMERRFDDLSVGQAQKEDVPRTSCAVNDFGCVPTFYPRIRAEITNTGLETFNTVPVVATVYDLSGNAIAASATRIASIAPRQHVAVVFTWNEPFTAEVGRVDIIPVPASR